MIRGWGKDMEHGDFIAVGKLGAVDAIFPDFMGQFAFIDFLESKLFEKFRFVSQREYFGAFQFPCIPE